MGPHAGSSYQVVADREPDAELVRNRLADKAKKLRALADGK